MTHMHDARADEAPDQEPQSVQRERVIDPVTGLAILRYRFHGQPRLQPQQEVPPGVWRVLRVQEGDPRHTLDTETVGNALALQGRAASLDDAMLERVLDILSGIRALGLTHGDLGVHRVYTRGDGLWLEGYGVPWRADADADQDVIDLARSLLDLPGTSLSAKGRRRLAAVIATGDPQASAKHLTPGSEAKLLKSREPKASPPVTAAKASFIKAPPPGSTFRSGETRPMEQVQNEVAAVVGRTVVSPEARRRQLMVIALVVGVIALASLSVVAQRRQTPVEPPVSVPLSGGLLVNVQVQPAGMPPVSLVVLESPQGSRLGAGSVVGTIPNRVLLDRAGVWRFEARFRDLRSAQARIILPEQRELVLVFPEPLEGSFP